MRCLQGEFLAFLSCSHATLICTSAFWWSPSVLSNSRGSLISYITLCKAGMVISLAFTGGRQRPAVVDSHLIAGVPGSSHSPERGTWDWSEALNSHTIKVNTNFMRRPAILRLKNKVKQFFSSQWCVLCCINTYEDSSITPSCESETWVLDTLGQTWFVFQGHWAHFLNSLQMTGSNRIMGRSGGRRGL